MSLTNTPMNKHKLYEIEITLKQSFRISAHTKAEAQREALAEYQRILEGINSDELELADTKVTHIKTSN